MSKLELETHIRLFAVVVYPIRMGDLWVSDFLMIPLRTKLFHPYLRQVFSNGKFLFGSILCLLCHFISQEGTVWQKSPETGRSNKATVTWVEAALQSRIRCPASFFYSVTSFTSIKKIFYLLIHRFGDFTKNEKALNRRGFHFSCIQAMDGHFLCLQATKKINSESKREYYCLCPCNWQTTYCRCRRPTLHFYVLIIKSEAMT